MASLSPGVLLRLLQDIDAPSSGTSPRRPLHEPPSVLQITGIVPALSGPDLRPDRGFYVKVSDASHSTFVSLSPDLNDLILADRLQIGQLINTRRLEPASPVPVLRDFRLLSGRHPCNHDTVDVAHPSPAPKSSPVFRPTAATPPVPPPEKKKRHSRSHSFADDRHQTLNLILTSSPTASPLPRSINMTTGLSVDDENYDSDDSRFSFTSSSSSSPSSSSKFVLRPRKSWNTGAKRCSFTSRNTEKSLNLPASPTKRKLPDSETSSISSSLGSSHHGTKFLIKQGKEVMRQRDTALQAAIDSLLEASASEKLIECLNLYAELQVDKDGDPQRVVNSFLNFHRELAQMRLIVQSLWKPNESSQVASERKSCATLWIKTAIESDLAKPPTQMSNATEDSQVASNYPCVPSFKPRNNASSKAGNLLVASNALQCEFNRRFLRYLERFLDSVSGSGSDSCEAQVAALLCQLKRVDDWLNNITSKGSTWPRDKGRDKMWTEGEEVEACRRVRRKIYGILLQHVESAAIALESMSVPDED
ncbi:uncharacterized protein LOC122007056 [Zingiber officinale]|uniref:uncharacterized protein LOC122007056 n=1 Tax=Zingiber officinale TaxID=94328 RepID=UPI001C4BA7E0|nr:uncharacterized protein LOC122007056 [Zingiber officinale]